VVNKYRQNFGDAFEIPMKNRFDPGIINKLVALIKKRDIDIIHTHGYKSDILGIIAARKAGIKCVVTPHGFENARDPKLRFFIWLGSRAMRFADRVVPLSPKLMDDVRQMGIKEKKLIYIQNGADLSEIEEQRQSRESLGSINGEKRIGFIGQLISRKNIFDIMDIFDTLSAKHSDIRLVLIGDGEQRAELESYAEQLDSSPKIEFLGFRDDRLELLQSFDLFVMTSTLEGIPRCLMEACAMGVPVAAYNIPGIDQLITHEKTGLLATPGDKKTLALYWEKLLFNRQAAMVLAENARQYVHIHYSAQRMAREYLDLFEQLASN
jgi:glycosyltransferase involved in cell wall biosynthesis